MTSPLEQKIKITGPVVITANRVGDGAVVYRRGGGWTTALDDADVTTSATEARELITAAIADDLNARAFAATGPPFICRSRPA
jgi:hypothetical protein